MIRVLAVLCLAALAMGQDAKAGGEEHHGDHGDHHGHHGEASELVSKAGGEEHHGDHGDHHGHHGEASELVSRTGRVSDAEADADADAEADADAGANPNPYLYGLYGYGLGGYRGYYGYPWHGFYGKRNLTLARSLFSTSLSQKEGQPSLFELRTTGAAGEYWGDLFGLYKLLPEVTGDGGSPVYRQMHDGDNAEYFLYRADGFWRMSDEVGKKAGSMRTRVTFNVDQMQPPVKGWEFWDGGKFQSDPLMECSREVTSVFDEVRVELYGAAKQKRPDFEGSYLPVAEKFNRGRWLLQHASGSDLYLSVRTGGTNWMISSTIDGDSGWIRSASAGTVSPASPSNSVSKRDGLTSWQYADDGKWHDGDIRVISIPRT